jgi:hypothetical protein
MRPTTSRPTSLPRAGANPPARPRQPLTPRQITANQNPAKLILNLATAGERVRQEMSVRPSLRPIAGYSETGTAAWRASNDRVFTEAADKFNRQRGLKPDNPKYIDPLLLKAWAMVESGGSEAAFMRDPLQVNNPGDWANEKTTIAGLAKGQTMAPELSAQAALKWLEYKGSLRGTWAGYRTALENYNGNKKKYPHTEGLPHRKWYARQIIRLYHSTR